MSELTDNQAAADESAGGRFFSGMDWAAFLVSGAVALGVYFYTLSPTVSLEDSGELCVAGDYMGVPHPPGYPIWTLLAWIFARVFSFVKFRGMPNPAWGIGLMSGVFGALASGITAMLICKSGRDMLRESKGSFHNCAEGTQALISWIGGVVCSLLFAFSPVMWSQSVIAEVYSLNAFFLTLIFLFTYRWMCRPDDKLLYLTAFTFGLGLTNYQVLALAALVLVIAVLLRDTALFRDFVIVGIPYAIAGLMLMRGLLPPIPHPISTTACVYVSMNFLVLILAYYMLPRGRAVAPTILFAQIGLAFYVFMSVVSDFRNPPMNWAYPRTWDGFIHALTRGQYEKIVAAPIFSERFLHQIGDFFADLRVQFTLLTVPLGFLPFTIWQVKRKGRAVSMFYLAGTLCVLGVGAALGEKFLLKGGDAFAIFGLSAYKYLFAGALLLFGIGMGVVVLEQVREMWNRLSGRERASLSERVTIALVFLGGVALALAYTVGLSQKIGDVTEPLRAANKTISVQDAMPIFKSVLGLAALIVLPFVILGAIAWLMQKEECDLRLPVGNNSQKWLIATLIGFTAMSVVVVALANPKGDIQDAFIQKVKFISSHALFAFWIGYGLIFALSGVVTFLGRNRLLRGGALAVALLIPLIPIRENIANEELLKIYGGAEQNGHDFGWQFGNYQLRGAEAILEELDPEEEPLPNPTFPPEMTRDAVFYGGTDPGRFVPTYMLYSARVREDVYLITQNALADGTYLNVMRDLYGDRIWIAAHPDSAEAFKVYVDEVRSGRRPPNAALRIEGGRVQVQGAVGVMEINGIIAKMIFEHNKHKHDFYVEESYVIGWMYPYLTPHGLIMKINREKCDISPDNIRDDLDFWDWYCRRFLSDWKFERDVVAMKSFSKLRSAIGGLYANKGRPRQAENAFQEARALYPLSPEANIRLSHEVYLREGRFAEARSVLEEFRRLDPGSDKTGGLIGNIEKTEQTINRMRVLETNLAQKKLQLNEAVELSDLYLQLGQQQRFRGLMQSMLQNTNLPPELHLNVSQLYCKAKMYLEMAQALSLSLSRLPSNAPPEVFLRGAEMYRLAGLQHQAQECIQEYLKVRPSDWKAWLDLSLFQLEGHVTNSALVSLRQALRFGGGEAEAAVRSDPRLIPLAAVMMRRPNDIMNMPGIPQASR